SHLDLAAAAAPRDHEILALEPDAFLGRRTYPGTVRASGGNFENECLTLVAFGPDGLTTYAEGFDPDREAEALARFAALAAGEAPRPAERVANAASRRFGSVLEAWRRRDAQRFVEHHPAPLRYRDHRRHVQLDLDRDGYLAFTRRRLAVASGAASSALLATRGERLALAQYT